LYNALKSVGLSLEGIGLLLAADRILAMCRTTAAVWGAAVVARWPGLGQEEKLDA
jgi:Na+/H+-dicarboxylate symporter